MSTWGNAVHIIRTLTNCRHFSENGTYTEAWRGTIPTGGADDGFPSINYTIRMSAPWIDRAPSITVENRAFGKTTDTWTFDTTLEGIADTLDGIIRMTAPAVTA